MIVVEVRQLTEREPLQNGEKTYLSIAKWKVFFRVVISNARRAPYETNDLLLTFAGRKLKELDGIGRYFRKVLKLNVEKKSDEND